MKRCKLIADQLKVNCPDLQYEKGYIFNYEEKLDGIGWTYYEVRDPNSCCSFDFYPDQIFDIFEFIND